MSHSSRAHNLSILFKDEDESLAPAVKTAIQKADQRRFIRDKLLQYKHLNEETKEQKLHFKLLGRVGYDRLPIPDIVAIRNQVRGWTTMSAANYI